MMYKIVKLQNYKIAKLSQDPHAKSPNSQSEIRNLKSNYL